MAHGEKPKLPIKTIITGVIGIFIALIALGTSGSMLEHMNATEIMVIQSLDGDLTWYTQAGYHIQALGTVTKYPKRTQYWFDANPDTGDGTDQSIKVRFNDGGEGHVSGSVAWEIPTDDTSLTAIHTMYGNPHNLEQQLIRTVVEKSVYMTGPLMSSRESFAERRNELIRFIEDQISGGVYETVTETVKEKDPMTGIEKTVGYVRIVLDDAGAPMRQEASPLTEFHIRTFNLSLNQIRYDERVEKQIESQQRATMQVQTAIAQAKEAEQAAITAEKNGQAEAAKAKWEQEVLKAKAVTKAEQQLEVARLEKAAAEQEKQKQILLGQGEATRRKLVMQADNALDARLAAYVKVNQAYATALQNIKQPIVPLVQSGKDGGGGGNGVQAFMDLLVAKTARELGVKVNPAK